MVAGLAHGLPQAILAPPWLLVVAGLLVGVGTRLGSGCTSGHGICGLARRSTPLAGRHCTFLAAGMRRFSSSGTVLS